MKKFLNEDEPVLHEHLKIIHQIAWDMSLKFNYDVEDLFSEGCLQYLLKREEYDESKGSKFTTYIWITIRNALADYIKFQTKLRFTDPVDCLVNLIEMPVSTIYRKHQVTEVFANQAF